MKPPIATLRVAGHIIAIYIDDLINVGLTYKECLHNIETSINLLQSLGFVIHFHISILTPSKNITLLGFQINSDSMTVKLTEEKKVTLFQSCKDLLEYRTGTIRHIAKVLGLITSSLPGVKYGGAHYRGLEYDKIIALRKHHGSSDAKMTISTEAVYDLKWWCKNIPTSYNDIPKTTPRLTVKTDACLTRWGAVFNRAKTGGQFTQRERSMHINSLELLAANFGLKTFIKTHNVHVKILSDNSTSVHGINRIGSSKSVSCNAIICEIWEWAEKHNVWITAAHIPGKQNVEADKESRRKNEKDKEWMLNREVFKQIIKQCDMYPKIDLFASRLNTELPVFVSYRPDPDAKIIDAFSIKWTESFYAFPPFSIIGRVIQKITLEESTGILIVPFWPTQP